jgi:hypothetical protein
MIVDLTDDEIRIVRALLIGDQLSVREISQTTRERIVLKLHFALEQANSEDILEPVSIGRVQ